jgi:SWI/SNF-related matrix-associated actin-dependent regulator of chromatin subfamily A member 5
MPAVMYSFSYKIHFVEFQEKEKGVDLKKLIADNWIEPPKRERKRNYSEAEYYRQAMRGPNAPPPKAREPRMPRMPVLQDFQFFDTARLTQLFEKEVTRRKVLATGAQRLTS